MKKQILVSIEIHKSAIKFANSKISKPSQIRKVSEKYIKLHQFISDLSFVKKTTFYKDSSTLGKPFVMTNIASAAFKNVCPDFKMGGKKYTYRSILLDLQSEGHIEINERYSTNGNFSKSYKLTPIKSKMTVQDIVERIESEEMLSYKKKYPNFSRQINSMYKMSIDMNACMEKLNSLLGKTHPKPENGKIINYEMTHILSYADSIQRFNNKEFHFSVCKQSGRFFTNLTSMPGIFIEHITIDKTKFVEIDGVNCQPWLLSNILDNEQLTNDTDSNVFYDKLGKAIIKNDKSLQEGIKSIKDNKKLSEFTRNAGKDTAFSILFTKHYSKMNVNAKKVVNEVYPGLIDELKLATNHEFMWKQLQILEVSLFQYVANRLSIDLFTKHDAIYIQEAAVPLVKEMIIERCKELGLRNINLK